MLEGYFALKQRHTTVRTEVIAGFTTFLTMAYIIFVNPQILSATGMDHRTLITVTYIVTAIATIIVGLVAKAPIAMAPGMGLNAFFAYLVATDKMSWQQALGVVFLSGLLFLILTLLGLRKRVVEAIPVPLISAIAVGIGLFITFIGLKNLGLVVQDEHTFVKAGPLTSTVLIGLFGLIVMIFFEIRKVTGSLLIGIAASTVLALICGKIALPEQILPVPGSFNIDKLAFRLDILGALKWSFFGSIFTLMFIDMFDSVGTLVTCCHQANMVDENNKIRSLDKLLGIDAVATMIGAVLGTSTTTSYIESAAGIGQGARTGLTSIVTGLLFFAALAFVPIVAVVPAYATAPALIMVGLFMMKEIRKIDFADIEVAFPVFILMVMIALSYSISTGLAFGFVSFALIKLISGKARQVKPAMWIIAILSILFLALDQIGALIQQLKPPA